MTDEMIKEYIDDQEGEKLLMTVDFQSTVPRIQRLIVEGCSMVQLQGVSALLTKLMLVIRVLLFGLLLASLRSY